MASEGRKATNQATFRQANEELERESLDLAEREPERGLPFICECSDAGCTQVLLLTIPEYEYARSDSSFGIMAVGHQDESIERVVKETDGWLVAEKLGEARRVHDATDPRS